MKKILKITAMLIVFAFIIFSGKSFAVSLNTINVEPNKTIVRPGEEVKVNISFGKELGAYTFNISYDNKIFEYVSVDGGTANDTSKKVNVVYFDSTGGTNPRTTMSVTFRAKSDITTSNPTEFTVTADGLSNSDVSETYDDITTPIVKNITVEPEYIDYTLNLETTGDIIKGEDKEMKLSYSSAMGRFYEHARLIAEAITPEGATVQLLGTDSAGLEHDIIQSGWGDAQGYAIGGKDIAQVLNVIGRFSEIGDYKITLKLIDRDNSDSVFAEKTFDFTALEPAVINENNPLTEPTTPEESITQEKNEEISTPSNVAEKTAKTPIKLPKTGINIYVPIVLVIVSLIAVCVYYNKRK